MSITSELKIKNMNENGEFFWNYDITALVTIFGEKDKDLSKIQFSVDNNGGITNTRNIIIRDNVREFHFTPLVLDGMVEFFYKIESNKINKKIICLSPFSYPYKIDKVGQKTRLIDRKQIIKHIVDTIDKISKKQAVITVYGKFFTGKSTLLNILKEQLIQKYKVIKIDWHILASSDEAEIRRLFDKSIVETYKNDISHNFAILPTHRSYRCFNHKSNNYLLDELLKLGDKIENDKIIFIIDETDSISSYENRITDFPDILNILVDGIFPYLIDAKIIPILIISHYDKNFIDQLLIHCESITDNNAIIDYIELKKLSISEITQYIKNITGSLFDDNESRKLSILIEQCTNGNPLLVTRYLEDQIVRRLDQIRKGEKIVIEDTEPDVWDAICEYAIGIGDKSTTSTDRSSGQVRVRRLSSRETELLKKVIESGGRVEAQGGVEERVLLSKGLIVQDDDTISLAAKCLREPLRRRFGIGK